MYAFTDIIRSMLARAAVDSPSDRAVVYRHARDIMIRRLKSDGSTDDEIGKVLGILGDAILEVEAGFAD